MLYLELFHGRPDPAQEMEDWGEQGPVFGPLQYLHTTYAYHVEFMLKNGECGELWIIDDMIYYDGFWYGDWSVFDAGEEHNEALKRLQPYSEEKAQRPEPALENPS